MINQQPTDWYRVRENALLFGVCAGLAERFQLPLAPVRVALIIGLFVGFPLVLGLYVLFTLNTAYREPPLHLQARIVLPQCERDLQEIAYRLSQIEDYVISDQFAFRRKL